MEVPVYVELVRQLTAVLTSCSRTNREHEEHEYRRDQIHDTVTPMLYVQLNPHSASRIVKTAPPSAAFTTERVPPCSVITRCASARPTPWPCDLVVKKGIKIFSKSEGGMPGPVSRIEINADCLPWSPSTAVSMITLRSV